MEFKLSQFSIVVLANENNPTILNPDFLLRTGIIDPAWDWELSSPPITTPPFSTVQYDSGITITVDTSKLQVSDGKCSSPRESYAARIVGMYLAALPHVRYSAIGFNFDCVAEADDPDALISETFLKDGPWNSDPHPLQSSSLSLVYPLEDAKLSLSIQAASQIQGDEAVRRAVLVKGNFHREIESAISEEYLSEALKKHESDWVDLQVMLTEIF